MPSIYSYRVDFLLPTNQTARQPESLSVRPLNCRVVGLLRRCCTIHWFSYRLPQRAIYGAFFIQFVPTYMQDISKAAPWAVYGVLMIAFMYAMPIGIAGFVRLTIMRFSRRTQEPDRGA